MLAHAVAGLGNGPVPSPITHPCARRGASPCMLEIAAACLVLTALFAYLNERFVGLPTSIGVMVTALALSLTFIGLDAMGISGGLRDYEASFLRSIDFSSVLMQGMLSLLLFAGALHIDLTELRAYTWQVGLLAVVGTVACGHDPAAAVLPVVRCLDLAHRSHRRDGRSQIRRRPPASGTRDRRRIAVQRWRGCGRLRVVARHACHRRGAQGRARGRAVAA